MILGGKDDAVIIHRVRAVIILGPEVSQVVKEQVELVMRLAAGETDAESFKMAMGALSPSSQLEALR
jgi:hypothetical protein